MGTLTLRLPEKLDARLTVLAAQTHQNRSELVRAALEKFLRDQERKQLMDTLVSEAKAAYADESVRREAREIAEDFLPLDNEALDLAEGRKPGDPEPERWWK
ncbi:MAG: ribbon-helix-helix protein, CopG family [Nitrosomonadaceae bacterium]|nr:ribbon-helix-helix protein, CopG family [Nitrosomonadaceae bacterium]